MPNFDTVLLNKQTDANQNRTFEYFNTKFHRDRWKQKQPFTFCYCVHNFYPWKDIVGKKVSNLRSIAELRAFCGSMWLLDLSLIGNYSSWVTQNLASFRLICIFTTLSNGTFWTKPLAKNIQCLKYILLEQKTSCPLNFEVIHIYRFIFITG